jgi:hypothetical protein
VTIEDGKCEAAKHLIKAGIRPGPCICEVCLPERRKSTAAGYYCRICNNAEKDARYLLEVPRESGRHICDVCARKALKAWKARQMREDTAS